LEHFIYFHENIDFSKYLLSFYLPDDWFKILQKGAIKTLGMIFKRDYCQSIGVPLKVGVFLHFQRSNGE
jgi:hypothetical protein